MNEQYETSIYRIAKKVMNSQVTMVHETKKEAEWFAVNHFTVTEGKYAYRIMRCVLVEDEGWHRVGATHIFNGRKVSEGEWTNAVRGLKS